MPPSGEGPPGGERRQPPWPPAPTPHWDNLAERRLDDINGQLREVRTEFANVWAELRKEIRAGDNRQNLLNRLDERMVEATRRIDDQLKDIVRRMDEWRRQVDVDSEAATKKLVSREEFDPVKKAVFTVIGALVLAVIAAWMRMVMK